METKLRPFGDDELEASDKKMGRDGFITVCLTLMSSNPDSKTMVAKLASSLEDGDAARFETSYNGLTAMIKEIGVRFGVTFEDFDGIVSQIVKDALVSDLAEQRTSQVMTLLRFAKDDDPLPEIVKKYLGLKDNYSRRQIIGQAALETGSFESKFVGGWAYGQIAEQIRKAVDEGISPNKEIVPEKEVLTVEKVEPFGIFLSNGGFVHVSLIDKVLAENAASAFATPLAVRVPVGSKVEVRLRKVAHHGLTGEVIRKEYDFLGFADAMDAINLK